MKKKEGEIKVSKRIGKPKPEKEKGLKIKATFDDALKALVGKPKK